MSSRSKKIILRALSIVLVGIVSVFFAYRYFGVNDVHENPRIQDLEKSINEIRAAINVDSVRQYNIQKIMKIINKYNESMPSGLKYEIADEIYNMDVRYTNLDVDLICATITHESGGTWEPEIVAEIGSMGLMQVMPVTSVWISHYEGITWTSPEEILFNPIYNIRIGSRQLSALIEKYGLDGGLAAYNAGEKRAALWLANNKADEIIWAETSNYIPHIMNLYEEYKNMTL